MQWLWFVIRWECWLVMMSDDAESIAHPRAAIDQVESWGQQFCFERAWIYLMISFWRLMAKSPCSGIAGSVPWSASFKIWNVSGMCGPCACAWLRVRAFLVHLCFWLASSPQSFRGILAVEGPRKKCVALTLEIKSDCTTLGIQSWKIQWTHLYCEILFKYI